MNMPVTEMAQEVMRLRELLTTARLAIYSVHKTFGAPGDYGYGTPQGDALKELYDAFNKISALPPAGGKEGGSVPLSEAVTPKNRGMPTRPDGVPAHEPLDVKSEPLFRLLTLLKRI